ncbi:hypothetical protein [Aequorivita xiaoshiensis]|uniref:Lipoprotein n=1 Tax=Aequorivita xiaoshiensis TaxID=2874476 RepID=A0A9X1UDS4_9FLAO|nr:hypothetical protein [Aequorivita xiaoshiensis]MCG2431881.1 hypothetical protein [Aequorivita xiaoshiensis]
MKKTILSLAIILAFLVSCNETKTKDVTTSIEEMHEHDTSNSNATHEEVAAEMHAINNAWVDEIKLDNGDKWEANIETTEGVNKMLDMLKSTETKTTEGYHALASNLNEVKNFVVKECTMEGPSHDNLHVFLHPLIEKIEALGKVSTVAEGAQIKKSIKENLDGYFNYFE